MIHKAYLHCLGGRVYELTPDLTISEEYSETLDSAVVNIPRVKKGDPIIDGLNPYSDVCLQIKDENGNEEYSSHFLVDSIDAQQVSYTDEAWFSVSISLMSQTKWLEKVQLPNVSMTHSLTEPRKSVKEWLDILVERYSPRINMGGGTVEPLLSVDASADWTDFENTPCADLSLSRPTLRQAITSLFTQCKALPLVKDRKISYLSLKAPQTAFSGVPCQPAERKSVSSDSWVNSLISEASQSVDMDSLCVSERICFRDRDNVLLQQKSNLKLETRFPIYKVTKLVMNGYVTSNTRAEANGWVGHHPTSAISADDGGATFEVTKDSEGASHLLIKPFAGSLNTASKVEGKFTFKASLVRPKANGNGLLTRFEQDGLSLNLSWEATGESQISANTINVKLFEANQYSPDGKDFVIVSGSFTGRAGSVSGSMISHLEEYSDEPIISTDGYLGDAPFMERIGVSPTYSYRTKESAEASFLSSLDITPLCLEENKRAQLDVNFLTMPEWSTPEKMAKWVYATVGYSIGSKEINGFSQTYDKSHGWWNATYTYIENIVNSVSFGYSQLQEYYGGAFDGCDPKRIFAKARVINPFFDNQSNNFSVLFFDLDYVPIAQFKGSFEKEDVPLRLQQLDSAENSVSDLNSLVASEGEKADRIGNPVWSLHTRVEGFEGVQPLNSSWEGKVVFKRTLKVGYNAIDCEYVLAKDYILQNYFTALSTKYRAYEYVDYSRSIERNELGQIYLRFSKDGHTAPANVSNAISFEVGDYSALPFIDVLTGAQNANMRLVGSGFVETISGGGFQLGRSEISAMCAGPSIYLTMSEYDNESDGPYVDGKYITPNGQYSDDPIGGVPQRWYGRRKEFGKLWFFSQLKPLSPREIDVDSPVEKIINDVKATQLYPRYQNTASNAPSSEDFDYGFTFDFNLVGKDLSERLALTLQATACFATADRFDDKGKARFSKWLYRLSSICGGAKGSLFLCRPRAWTEAEYDFDPSLKIAGIDKLLEYVSGDGKKMEFKVNEIAVSQTEPFDLVYTPRGAGKAKTIAHFEPGSLGPKMYLDVCRAKSDKSFFIEGEKGVLYAS